MKIKKLTSVVVLCFFLIGLMSNVAIAGKEAKADVSLKLDNRSVKLTIKFDDIKDAVWAFKQISKMVAEDIIKGYSDGSFKPNKPVTQAEAVVLAMRSGGYLDNPSVTDSVYLPFKDAAQIPAWAKQSIALAVDKGFIARETANFQPNKPATRQWAAVLIAKIYGLSPISEVELPFKDAAEIAPEAAGYIAAAIKENIISGFPNGNFQPNKPVTRAQMAVMLEKGASETIPYVNKNGKLSGTVVSKTVNTEVYTQGTITLALNNKENTTVTLPVAKEALIYINDKEIKLGDIAAGTKAQVIVKNEMAVFIEIRSEKVKGVVHSVYSDKIELMVGEGKRFVVKAFEVGPDAKITINGKSGTMAGLTKGAYAHLTLNEKSEAVEIKAHVFSPRKDDKKLENIEKKVEKELEKHLKEIEEKKEKAQKELEKKREEALKAAEEKLKEHLKNKRGS